MALMQKRWRDYKGIIFDLDGVLWDSSPVHSQAYQQTFAEYEINNISYDFIAGMRADEAVIKVFKHLNRKIDTDTIEEIVRIKRKRAAEILRDNPPIFQGIIETIQKLSEKFSLAIASSTRMENIQIFLNATNTQKLFKTITTSETVRKSKPDPEILFQTLSKMGLQQNDVFYVEDAVNGVKCGRNAGIRTIGVTTLHSAQELLEAGASHILRSATELTTIVE